MKAERFSAPERAGDTKKNPATDPCEVAALLLQLRADSTENEDRESDAFAALMDRYLPLIEKTVSRFEPALFSEADREDLRQEALMSFYRAALSFDAEQNHVSFGLYAQICMTNRMISCVRCWARHAEEQPLSMEDEDAIPADEGGDPSFAYEAQERLEHTYKVLRRVLSSFEFTVWRQYLGGSTAKEIAAKLGKSEKSITNAIGRIRRKLKTARAEFDF